MNTLQERLRANVMTHSRALYTAAADRIDALEAEVAMLRLERDQANTDRRQMQDAHAALESAREVQDAALAVARADFRELALRAEKLEAENAALLADAERWRHWRKNYHYTALQVFDYSYSQIEHWTNEQNEAKLDSALDAARSKT